MPCKRSDFIKALRKIGFTGLYSVSKHQFMVYGQYRLTIPSNNKYPVDVLVDECREQACLFSTQ